VREVTKVPDGKRLPPTENSRNKRLVCWQCRTGYLRRKCPRRPGKEVIDNYNWRRDCAAGGNSQHQETDNRVDTPPHVTLLPDEKQRLEAHISALEKQNKEMKVKLAKLEAAQKTKTKATITAMKRENNSFEVQRHTSCWKA
jgi:hypothetical protein